MSPKTGGRAWITPGDGSNSVAGSGLGNLGKDSTTETWIEEGGGSVVERLGLT